MKGPMRFALLAVAGAKSRGGDQHCQSLARAAGAGDRAWRAYLSTQVPALNDPKFVNARDRIGAGPWQNANGVVIATSVDDLHSPASKLTKQTLVDERGQMVNGRTEKPNKHDMLTGSRPDGTAFPGAPFGDMTCAPETGRPTGLRFVWGWISEPALALASHPRTPPRARRCRS